MKKKLFILFSLVYFLSNAQPGKEAWHWEFGLNCSIDFSSGIPIAGNSSFSGVEGAASISDKNTGQLLFYTNGNRVWNKNNNLMFNGSGLKGHQNSTQSALIIPNPSSSTIYYLFTLNLGLLPAYMGLYYSVIDINQQGGLGAVTLKNKMLIPPASSTTEKLVGVKQCNGKDYWAIAHLFNSNTFNAFRVTSTGIDTTPVVSNTGTIEQNTSGMYSETKGYLKASPDGKKLALGFGSDSLSFFEIFDFDNSTGLVSNPITIQYAGGVYPYGVSFSPDNSKVYVSLNLGGGKIYQYDLSSGVSSIIIASQILIANNLANSITFPEALQLAPDGKIYLSRYYVDTLAVINNPNSLGTSCGFQLNGLILPPSSACQAGLPNFIDANYAGINLNIPDVQLCNTFSSQTLDAGSGFTNYFWSTGANTQTISINTPGKYWVTVTSAQGCTRTDTVNAYLLKPLKQDTIYCGPAYTANVTQGGVLAYNWYDANNNPIRNFTQSGTYWVDISYINGCAIRDSITLTIFPAASVSIGPDTIFCLGNLTLNALNPTANFLWSTGETTQSINATKAGTYWVIITDANGCKAKDTMIVRPQLSAFNFVMPNIVTPNNDNINDVIDFSVYQFSSFQLEIYNRWGQKLFECSEPNCIWKPSEEDGTYFYTAQYKIECGSDSQTKEIKGFITVVK